MLITHGKAKRFNWILQDNDVTIEYENRRIEKYPLEEILDIMNWLKGKFGVNWFPLANNVEKLGKDIEIDGLGVAILRQRPRNISHAQGSSYLGVVLDHVGILEWNGRQKGIEWRIVRPVRSLDDLRKAMDAMKDSSISVSINVEANRIINHDVKKYRRDFCLWATVRAAQAGSAKAKGNEFTSALEACGLIEFLDTSNSAECDEQQFNEKHKGWISFIRNHIRSKYRKEISYGIAAKLVAVFIKGYFILDGNQETSLAKVAHPPIDSFLLKGIDEDCKTNLARSYKWQKLEEDSYFKLISELHTIKGAGPFWAIEKYWKL